MATYYSNRPIVTRGLLLYHDFGNPKCYVSGSGVLTNDLSGNGHVGSISGSYHGTSTGLGGFVTSSLGAFYAEDTAATGRNNTNNPYVTFGMPASLDLQPSTDSATLSIWLKVTDFWCPDSNRGWQVWGRGDYNGSFGIDANAVNPTTLRFSAGTRNTSGVSYGTFINDNNSGLTITTGSVYNIVCTYRHITPVESRNYINGIYTGPHTGQIQEMTGSSWTNSGTYGHWRVTAPGAGGGNRGSGSAEIYNVSLYNVALTAEEVKQNFEALRGRFDV